MRGFEIAVAEVRKLAASDVAALEEIESLLRPIPGLVTAMVDRWRQHAAAGGDPRLQRRHMGSLHVRYAGDDLRALVVARLQHLLRAQSSPFRPRADSNVELGDVARHDQGVVEAHCRDFEKVEDANTRARRHG